MKKLTSEVFLKRLKEISPGIELIEPYKDRTTEVKVLFRECGHIEVHKPIVLLRGIKCKKCRTITPEDYEKAFKSKNPHIILMDSYKNSRTPIRCLCEECGFSWDNKYPSNMSGCPKCAGRHSTEHRKGKTHKKTNAEFVEEIISRGIPVTPLEQYTGNKALIRCKCNVCGFVWKIKPNNLLSGYGCPKCAGHIKTNEEFIQELREKKPKIKPLEPYRGASRKILCECLDCGYQWRVRPHSLTSADNGCPKCAKVATSLAEQIIYFAFVSLLGDKKVLNRDKSIGKELDVFIPQYGFAIEFGAWYYHRNRLLHDKNKFELCKKKGIVLHQILEQVTDINKAKEVLADGRFFSNNISGEKDYVTLKLIINDLCVLHGIKGRIDWNLVINQARNNCGRKTEREFLEFLQKNHPNQKYLGGFNRMKDRVHLLCLKCGHTWSISPSGMYKVMPNYCPNCSNHHKKKRVLCLDTSTIYSSIKEASQSTGCDTSAISACCRGKQKASKGIRWQYID